MLAGCGEGVDSGGLTANDRNAAQAAMDALQASNISRQLVTLSNTAGRAPAACRVRLESKNPATFEVYVFWVPYIGPLSYTWLNMRIEKNVAEDKFHLGSAEVLRRQLRGGAALELRASSTGGARTGARIMRYHGSRETSFPSPAELSGAHERILEAAAHPEWYDFNHGRRSDCSLQSSD